MDLDLLTDLKGRQLVDIQSALYSFYGESYYLFDTEINLSVQNYFRYLIIDFKNEVIGDPEGCKKNLHFYWSNTIVNEKVLKGSGTKLKLSRIPLSKCGEVTDVRLFQEPADVEDFEGNSPMGDVLELTTSNGYLLKFSASSVLPWNRLEIRTTLHQE